MRRWKFFVAVGCGVLLTLPLRAIAVTDIDEVVVTATRQNTTLAESVNAVSVVAREDIQTGRQQLGLDESLTRVPGIFFQNRYNFAQDLRVAIRGFGARANFGIRGIKLFVDGLPATLADGQGGVDDIDLGSVGRFEVIRGPASSIYGASAGGVISIFTEDGPEKPFVEGGVTVGEYDHQKYQLKAGGQYDKLNYLINSSHLENDGYRGHSRVEHSLVNSKFRYDFDTDADLTVIFNLVDSPMAEDAGAITRADIETDRRQAQARNLASNAGEELTQQRFGWVYRHGFGEQHEITVRNYYLWRDFQTFLPIGSHIPFVADDGVVEFDRFFFGGGAQYTYSGGLLGLKNQFTAGFDIDIQQDDRQRFINDAGVKGALAFDQQEEAESYGFYFRDSLALTGALTVTVGGRYDMIDLSVEDRFLGNADQSSRLEFDEFSPSIGISWRATKKVSLYANYGTAFETPTFTELANPARNLNVNLGGFNNVSAQTAESFEIGARGTLWDRVYFDLAAFTMDVDDEVTSVSNLGSRSFFENADTTRDGVEAALVVDLTPELTLSGAFTYSEFEFDRFPDNVAAEGNALPGIPEHQFFAELAYRHPTGFYVVWDLLIVDEFFVNNANSDFNESYEVANLRAGHRFVAGGTEISPFLGVNNLFSEKYNSNARLNAFGGRTFEPAPTANIYGGISVRFGVRSRGQSLRK